MSQPDPLELARQIVDGIAAPFSHELDQWAVKHLFGWKYAYLSSQLAKDLKTDE